MGVDLYCFSGGKGLAGPQCSGLLLGRKDLIEAALANTSPWEGAVCRAMKVRFSITIRQSPATRRLKRDPKTDAIPVILLTGYSHIATHRHVLEAGVDVFLRKPCLPQDLEDHVRRLLDRRAERS